MYKVDNPQLVVVFGIRTQFGGGRTSGFGLIYDNLTAAKKFESKYRQIRVYLCLLTWRNYVLIFFSLKMGLDEKKDRESRKLRKDRKNRGKKKVGKEKTKILYGK